MRKGFKLVCVLLFSAFLFSFDTVKDIPVDSQVSDRVLLTRTEWVTCDDGHYISLRFTSDNDVTFEEYYVSNWQEYGAGFGNYTYTCGKDFGFFGKDDGTRVGYFALSSKGEVMMVQMDNAWTKEQFWVVRR